MGRGLRACIIIALVGFASFAQVGPGDQASDVLGMREYPVVPEDETLAASATEILSHMSGFFTENLGQEGNSEVRFYTTGNPLSAGLTTSGVIFIVRQGGEALTADLRSKGPTPDPIGLPIESRTTYSFSLLLEGCNPVVPRGEGLLGHPTNFLLGSDTSKWVRGARSFEEVWYDGIWDGIDLRFYFRDGRLKYDIVVGAGVNPSAAMLRYVGTTGLDIEQITGDLLVTTPAGNLRDDRPVILQEGRSPTDGAFRLVDRTALGFELGPTYDPDLPAVIDPGFEFSTLLGGSDDDFPIFVGKDDELSVVVVGQTNSTDFVVTPGAFCTTFNGGHDLFISKLDSTASHLLFSTLIGGVYIDRPIEACLMGDGSILVTGSTEINVNPALNFPTTSDHIPNEYSWETGFLLQLSNDGSNLIYSTFFGGSDLDRVQDMYICATGDVYLAGTTYSVNLPITQDAFCATLKGGADAFVLKLDLTQKQLTYCTYIGGNGNDQGGYLNVDSSGNIYVAGSTSSLDFPTTPDAFCQTISGHTNTDVFALKLNADGSQLIYSTYIRGSSSEHVDSIRLLDDENLYLEGETNSRDFPLTPGAFCQTKGPNGRFILGLKPDGTGLIASTFLFGGYRTEYVSRQILKDGSVGLVGYSNASDFPTTSDALNKTHSGERDVFIMLLDPTMTHLDYSTFIGGNWDDFPAVVTWDLSNNQLWITGSTSSTNLPTSIGCYDPRLPNPPSVFRSYLVEFNMSTRKIDYCTYFGGSFADGPRLMQPDEHGHLVIVGTTDSPDFPLSDDAFDTEMAGSIDLFVLGIDPRPCDPQPKPTGVSARGDNGFVDLGWDPPKFTGGIALSHRIYKSTSPGSETLFREVPYFNKTAGILGLTDEEVVNGVTYYYRVSAINARGESELSDAISVTPRGPPTEPLNVTGRSGDGTVHLIWEPPMADGGHPVQGYKVFRCIFGEDMSLLATVTDGTNLTDPNVETGTFYYYTVLAFTSFGNGPPCKEVRVKALNVPSPPGGFTVAPADGQVKLTWNLPVSDGGSMLLGFKVYRGNSPETMTLLATLSPMALEYTDTGLTNGANYIYYVTAYSEVGESQMSLVLDAIPFTLPGQPLALVARAGDRWVELAWEPPGSDGGRPVTHYNLYSSDDPGDLQLLVSIGAVTTFNNTGLTNGVTYYYQVQAVTEAGESQRSEVASARPMGLPGAPADLAGAIAAGGVRLTWRAPASLGGADSLTYTVLRGGTADGLAVIATGVDALEYFDASIVVGSTYFYSVRAVSSVGEGPPAITVSVTAVSLPGGVMDLQAIAFDGKVHLIWMPPGQDGGSPVTGYVVLRGLMETGMAEVARVGAVTNYTDTTVANGKRYLYAVSAINAVGTGPRGELVEATPIGAPGAVGLLTAQAKDGAIVLTWAAPAAAGRAPVTGYTVLRGESADALAPFAYLGNVLTYTDPTVEEGKTYFYSVVPKSGMGDGQRAPAVTGKVPTLKDGPGPGAVAALGALGVLAAVATARRRR